MRFQSGGANRGTYVPTGVGPVLAPAFDARSIFERDFSAVQQVLETYSAIGLFVGVYGPRGELIARGWAPATGRTRSLVLGRHEKADLRVVEEHPAVSLRHLMILCRAIDGDELRLRVLDLDTPLGFTDEQGRRLRSVTAEGTLFLAMGPLRIMLLVTGPLGPRASYASDAYEMIPERVFIEEKSDVMWRRPEPRRVASSPRSLGSTVVTVMDAPVTGAALIHDDEGAVGELVIEGPRGSMVRKVGANALDRGVLIGRYERCELSFIEDERVSRVHLLVIRDGAELLAIDTASTNGIHVESGRTRIARLTDGSWVQLPGLRVRWDAAAP